MISLFNCVIDIIYITLTCCFIRLDKWLGQIILCDTKLSLCARDNLFVISHLLKIVFQIELYV